MGSPVIGQLFTKNNNRPGKDKVAVLTQSFWETQFGQDPAVLKKTVWIDGEALRIIGVAPRVLEAFDAASKSPGRSHGHRRRRPGVTRSTSSSLAG